mgnify:FL=1
MSRMLSIRDLKVISADAYARGALVVTAETIMDVAADVVDMLIMREHYKISSALKIVGMFEKEIFKENVLIKEEKKLERYRNAKKTARF